MADSVAPNGANLNEMSVFSRGFAALHPRLGAVTHSVGFHEASKASLFFIGGVTLIVIMKVYQRNHANQQHLHTCQYRSHNYFVFNINIH